MKWGEGGDFLQLKTPTQSHGLELAKSVFYHRPPVCNSGPDIMALPSMNVCHAPPVPAWFFLPSKETQSRGIKSMPDSARFGHPRMFLVKLLGCSIRQVRKSRSFISALFTLLWGRVPLLKTTTEKKGTLILASLLEDLEVVIATGGISPLNGGNPQVASVISGERARKPQRPGGSTRKSA